MSDLPAWAMEKARKLDTDILNLASGTGPMQHQNKLCWLARALVEAKGNGILIGLESAAKNYIAGRNEALEEAALAADGFTGSLLHNQIADLVADAIRALKSPRQDD